MFLVCKTSKKISNLLTIQVHNPIIYIRIRIYPLYYIQLLYYVLYCFLIELNIHLVQDATAQVPIAAKMRTQFHLGSATKTWLKSLSSSCAQEK